MKRSLISILVLVALCSSSSWAGTCDPIGLRAQNGNQALARYKAAHKAAFMNMVGYGWQISREIQPISRDDQMDAYVAAAQRSSDLNQLVQQQSLTVSYANLDYLECVASNERIDSPRAHGLLQLRANVFWTLWSNGALTPQATRRLSALLDVLRPLATDDLSTRKIGPKI